MDKNFLIYKKARVHYLKFGHGEKLLIALHGFAERGEMFMALEESLKEQYTVYCLDLPFHGLTEWPGTEYNRSDLSALFKLILDREKKERLDLMGFSLGGRIVQKMLFEWYSKVDKVFLIAPYGLTDNFDLVPQKVKSFFNRILHRPDWFFTMIKLLHRLGWISRYSHNFAYHHVHTGEKRNRLFKTWIALYHFKLNPRKVKAFLQEKSITVELYFGSKDKVIPVSLGEKLSKNLPCVNLYVLDSNHLLINNKLNLLLKKQLS